MPLTVGRRKSTRALTIVGTVAGTRIRRRAQSDDPKLAAEEAAALEADILRTAWHGERRGSRSFAEAALSYVEAEPRSENHKARVHRLLKAMGDIPLSGANQEKALELKRKLLRADAAPGTYTRAIIMPMRAILNMRKTLGGATCRTSSCRVRTRGAPAFYFRTRSSGSSPLLRRICGRC
jgi:hypothetical protein